MVNWEQSISNSDLGKKYSGNERLIDIQDPIWIKGFRLVMKS